MTPRIHDSCTVPSCGREHEGLGLCHSHLVTYKRTGTWPTKPIASRDPAVRFWAKVDKSGDCWLWQGATDGGGRYGGFQYQGRVQRAHRVALMLSGVDVPEAMDVDHLCRVTLCVRPGHLEVVTHRTNVMRGESLQAANATKTHCPRGHRYDLVLRSGGRWCSICAREAARENTRRYRARKRAAQE